MVWYNIIAISEMAYIPMCVIEPNRGSDRELGWAYVHIVHVFISFVIFTQLFPVQCVRLAQASANFSITFSG